MGITNNRYRPNGATGVLRAASLVLQGQLQQPVAAQLRLDLSLSIPTSCWKSSERGGAGVLLTLIASRTLLSAPILTKAGLERCESEVGLGRGRGRERFFDFIFVRSMERERGGGRCCGPML